jgi:hypothetical protein
MPKKQKRRVSAPVEQAGYTPATTSAGRATPGTSRATYTQEFNPDYRYVKHDLRQIGIMAGSFFVILVVLSFFLR